MAVGDAAQAAGYALVPSTGVEDSALVKFGSREINRTRDYVAELKSSILPTLPVANGGTGASTKADARIKLGIRYGTGVPSDDAVNGSSDGDIYFRIVT